MKKPGGRLPTTRLFSMQLANHDALFAPREKRRRSFAWLKLTIVLLPALLAFCFPSFRIGRAVLRDPGVKIPEALRQGDIFTVPAAEDEDVIPAIDGRTLGLIDGKNPMYMGAALKPFDFDISFEFTDDDQHKRQLKSLLPHAKHPTYPIFVKRVHVTPDESLNGNAFTIAGGQGGEFSSPTRTEIDKNHLAEYVAPPIEGKELKVYQRFDGNIRLRCWKAPVVEPLGIDPLKPRRHPHMGSLNVAGTGEVVYSGTNATGESVVVLYHGGGLFTRYWALKELKLPKSGRLTAGQILGYVHLAPPKKLTPATWQPLLGGTGGPGEIKGSALLELSSRLCDSK